MTSAPRRTSVPGAPWRTFQEPPPSESLGVGSTLGALAIAVGLGVLGVYMLDLHGHTCCRCGHKWKHFGAFNLGDEESHTCSACGEIQWWKCGVPHVLRGSQFVASPHGSPPQPPFEAFPTPVVPPALAAPPTTSVVPPAHVVSAPRVAALAGKLNYAPPATPLPRVPMLALQARRRSP